jgi:hypothetical protein
MQAVSPVPCRCLHLFLWPIRPFVVSVSGVEAQTWVGGRSACG